MRLAVSKLKGSGELTSRRAPSYILLSLVKYDDYQSNRIEEGTHKGTQRALEGHSKGTQRALNNNDNNVNNDNNDNNIRSTDIKFLKDAYVKNERLHQLTYNNRTLKIRLFKLTLRGFLCFYYNLFNFRFFTH